MTINKSSVLCVQELICCTAAATFATKHQTNASGSQLGKNCASHVYKERIHSANVLQNTPKYSCPKQGCKSSHSVLLHGVERVFSKSTSSKPKLQNSAETSSKKSIIAAAKTCKGLLQIAEVNIAYKGRTRKVLAMLDSGSTHTLIAETIAEELSLPGEMQTIRLFGINNEKNLPT